MAMYKQGFRAGTRALEISQADKTQNGLLVAENVDLERDGVLRKRPGSDVVSLVRSSDPADLIPTDQMQALYSRDAELILETDRELYARQQCGLAAGETAGTATPAEISDALDAIDVRSSPTQTIDVPLTGSGTAGSTRTRLDRADVPTTPVVITPSGRSVSVELSVAGGIVTWTATEGAGTDSAPLTGAVQRIARIDSVAITPTAEFEAEAVRITWVAQNGGVATLEAVTLQLWKTTNPSAPKTPPAFTPAYTTLTTLRGTAAGASYESSGGAVAAFEVAGTLRVWEFDALGNSQGYAVADPPDDTSAYAVDVSANLFPADTNGLAVAWASSSDGIAHASQLKTDGSTVLSQMSYSGILTGSPIQIAIFDGPIISWDIADKTGSQASGTRMVWRFNPLDTAIRAIDLPAGASMRMQFVKGGGVAEYDIADATTTNQLYPQRPVQGIAGAIDSQWGQQTDTIYGVLTSDTGGFFEVLWERTAEVAVILVDAAVFSAALAVSTNRLTATWWPADTDLRIRYRTLITDAPIDAAFAIASGIGVVGGVISAAVEFEDAGSTAVMGSATWRDDGQVLSLYVREFDGSIFMERVDGFPEIPAFAAEIQGSPNIGPFRIIFSVKYAETFEVYEVTPTLFVRVSPVQEVRAGGNWASRGTWTRTRLSSDVVRYHGSSNVVSSDAATVLNDQGVPCTFVATEVDGAIGALFDVVTTHNEAQGVIDATGKRPRVSPFDSERLAVSFESAALELVTGTWSPGSAISFTPTGHTLLPERSWDQASFEADGESAVVLAAVDDFGGAASISFHIYPDIAPVLNLSAGTGVTTIVDVGVSARALPDGVSVQLAWGVVGYTAPGVNNQLVAGVVEVNLDTLAVNFLFSRSVPYPGGTAVEPVAVSVDSRDGLVVEAWVELEGPVNRHVEVVDVEASKHVPLTQWKRCALVSQLAPLNGSVVGAISLLGTSDTDFDVDVGTFVGGKPYRDGVILLSARTGERVGRVGFGEVEDFAERQLRPPKTGLNIGPGGELVLGWQETDLDVGTARAPLSVLYRWDPVGGAHAPAVLDSILVSPHGGCPRMYDGQNVNEHGFQYELPEIVQVTSPAVATTLEAGPYSLALTWEAYDATGKLYRSRPTKAGPFTLVAGDVLNVFYRDLTQTEWPEVRIVAWRTAIIDGSQTAAFYRETEGLAQFPAGTDTAQISLSLPNLELVDRERLDQGEQPGDVLEADPIAITDWSANANGRIWSRDPRSGGTVRHTVTRREGFGLHWSPGQIVEHNGVGDINALAEMNGRVAMLSALDGSAFYGDGPNETGAGGYSVPAHLTLKIGAESQATVAIIPEGLVYGARRGVPPQLLTGGWTSAPLGSDVAAAYHRDGQTVIAAAYVQESDTLHVFDDGQEGGDSQTLRFHFGSRHWANDTLRQALDSTVLGTGQLAILTIDGRVLLENLGVYASGEIGYISRVRTSWMTAAPGKASTNGNFVAVHIVGSYEGAHGLRLLIRYDYREAVIETAFISAATLAAHALEGREYAYAYNTHGESMRRAISVEVQDLGEPNETWSIEAILVESRVDSAVLAELPDGQQFDAEP